MIKRTSINLDLELVEAAKAVLETKETTETVHRALRDVVRHEQLRRLAARRFELADEELAALRASRAADLPLVTVKR